MQAPSREVHSSQRGVHPGLAALIKRHAQHPWQKPLQQVDIPALKKLDEALQTHSGPLVLDSFCGTGQSTALLAKRHSEALVVGVDQSAHRLARGPGGPDNCLFLQAHCEAVWRHLCARKQRLLAHYLLYPNPWPKPAQLGRRIHGHPAFPLLLELGGALELRSNWQIYVEEFGVALNLCGYAARIAAVPAKDPAMTLFEDKYRQSGHALWSLSANLTARATVKR